jgi:hypothetical protein
MQGLNYGEKVIDEYGDYANIFIDYIKSNCTIPKEAAGRINAEQGDYPGRSQ